MLEILLRADGRPVSTDRTLEHVWGFGAEPESNIIQVNIAALRRKLSVAEDAPAITTNRGVGYSIASENGTG